MVKVPHNRCDGKTVWVDEEVLYGELPELGDEFDDEFDEMYSLLEERLEPHHMDMLISESRISYECIFERGYFSATAAEELDQLGFAGFQQRVPALVMPIHDVDGNVPFYRVRPDNPRSSSEKPDKFVKYEQPARTGLVLDVPPTSQADLQNPNQRLWITEGEKKADSLASQGEYVIGLLGIWGWKREGKPLADWQKIPLRNREVCVAFDADIVGKTPVQQALRALVEFLRAQGARVRIVRLEQVKEKNMIYETSELKGIDDFLAHGFTPEQLLDWAIDADAYLEGLNSDNFEDSENSESGSWRPPVPFDAYTLPEFPMDALPGGLRQFASKLSVATQTPPTLAAGVGLGAISVAFAKKVEVEPRSGWEEPLVLWILTLLESGERKTAVMGRMRRPLDEWVNERSHALRPDIAVAESMHQILEQQRKSAEKAAAKGEEGSLESAMEVAQRLEEHEVPSLPQLTTSDTTAEAAAVLCARNDGRIGVWSDEAEIIKIIAGRYSKDQSPDVEIFLKGHAGGYYNSSRVGRDSVSLRDPAIPMVLALQPEVLRGLSNQRTLHGQGFFARYLYSLPASALGGRKARPEPVDEVSYEGYSRLLKSLLDVEIPTNDFGEVEPHTLGFSEGADDLLEDFQNWVEPQLAPSGAMASFKEWGSKLPGVVVRIAGVLHVADQVGAGNDKPWEIPVDRATFRRAIKIGLFYLEHARAAMAEMGADAHTANAKHVLKVLEDGDVTHISMRDLFQRVRGNHKFAKMEDLEPAVKILEQHGYVRLNAKSDERPRRRGRKASPVLEINPLALSQNSHNPQNSTTGRVTPFFEWLEKRRGPEDPEDPPPSTPPRGPSPNGHSPVDSAPHVPPRNTALVEAAKEHETIGSSAPSTSRPTPTTKKKTGAGAGKKREFKKKDATFEEIVAASKELAQSHNLVVDKESALKCKAWVESCSYIAVDTETKGETKDVAVNYLHGPIRLVQLHYGGTTWFVDGDVAEDGDVAAILKALRSKPLYFHNALFDVPRIERRFGVYLGREDIRDCLIASRTARAGEWSPQRGGTTKKKSHDLGAALERELGVKIKKDCTLRWGGTLTEDHLRYASDDVGYLHPLYEALQEVIDDHDVRQAYEDTLRVLPVYTEAQMRGVPLDKERFESLLENLQSKVEDELSRLQELAPAHPDGDKWVWNNTNKNEEELGDKNRGRNGALRALKLAGAEVPDLKEKTLLDHADGHPIVKALLEYRQKVGVFNKYKHWIAKYFENGRIHPQAQLASLVTGRTPYTNPQIQNMDKRKYPEFRECIKAEEGWKIVKADFAQQELRIVAYFSGDEKLKTIFLNGEDPHLETGSKIAGRPITKDDPERDAAKRANFGFVFGGGVRSYRATTFEDYGIVLTEKEGKRDQDAFREAWPGVYAWQKRFGGRHGSEADAWVTRSVRGRRRYVSRSKDRYGRFKPKYTDRLNGPVQSTGADILYRTLCRLDTEQQAGVFADVEILISSHDEIVLHAPQSSAEEVAEWLKDHMRAAMAELIGEDLATKTEHSDCVESYIGDSWRE